MKKTIWTLTILVLLVFGAFLFNQNKNDRLLYAYIPNADDGSISVIDTVQDEVVRTFKIDDQLSDGIEASKDGKWIYAGNYQQGELFVIEAESGKVKEKIQTGKNLHGIDQTPDGKYLYLASGDFKDGKEYNYITVIDTANHEIIRQIESTAKSPSHIDFSRDGSVAYIANILSNEITLLDTSTFEFIATIPAGRIPNEVEPSQDDKYLYVGNVTDGTVSILDIFAGTEVKTVKVGEGSHGLALSKDGKFLYVANRTSNDVIKLNLETEEVVARVVTGETANHVSLVPNTDKLYVTNKDSNDLTIVDVNTFEIIKKVELGKTPHEMSFAAAVNN